MRFAYQSKFEGFRGGEPLYVREALGRLPPRCSPYTEVSLEPQDHLRHNVALDFV